MIKSLRIDPTLAARVRRAARARGTTESEFMREAIEGLAREVLEHDEGESLYERTRHLILPPAEVHETFVDAEDLIEERYARIVAGYRRREAEQRDSAAG
jgi:hypothetical protein